MQNISDILPIDGYRIKRSTELSMQHISSLTHLYQPLIGIEAISLYHLLLQESYISHEVQTHHTLMNYLNVPLYRINDARLKLEGIGLLKTYREETDDRDVYTYVLQVPFTPKYFFQDVMLAEMLYRQIGEQKFTLLNRHYAPKEEAVRGEQITAPFEAVFQSIEPSEEVIHATDTNGKEREEPHVPLETTIDFTFLQEQFRKKQIPIDQLFTEKNKTVVRKLAVIYDLTIHELEKAIEWALTEQYELDLEQFKKACHDLFRMKENVVVKEKTANQTQDMQKEDKVARSKRSENEKKRVSKVDRLIEHFETASPKQILEDLSSGKNASERDMLFIRDLMLRQGLSAPVMNVLIHFVMLRSDMKLPRNYMETVASNWSRKKFKTAKEAFLYAREQMKKRPEKKRAPAQEKKREEVLPEWFKNREHELTNKEKERKHDAKEEAEIVALIEKYAQDQ